MLLLFGMGIPNMLGGGSGPAKASTGGVLHRRRIKLGVR